MFDPLAKWLPSCEADMLCLQEVTRTPGLTGWTRFQDAERQLPQRANLFDDVRSRLPGHQASFVASDAGPVSTDDEVHVQEFGLGTFINDRVTIVGHRTSFVHGAFTEHDEWAIADRPRVASAYRMIAPDVEFPVVVVQLHGFRDPAGKADTRSSRYAKPVRHANYMLVSDPEHVRSFEILADPEVSDHRPLVLEI